jgi:hypothetical protein
MSIIFPAAYIGEDPYIFISYAHRDSAKSRLLSLGGSL